MIGLINYDRNEEQGRGAAHKEVSDPFGDGGNFP